MDEPIYQPRLLMLATLSCAYPGADAVGKARIDPWGAGKLKLSNMNMGGMGTCMMKGVMKKKNVLSLPQLIEYAQLDENISMVACEMSMDVMGLSREELIDGVEMGGVGAFVNSATSANSKGVVSFT